MKSYQELIDEGFNFCNSRKFEQAIQIADQVLSNDSKFMEAYRLKFKSYQGQGRNTDLISLASKAYKIDPDYKFALYYEGIALRNQGKFQRSLDVLDRAINLYPEWDFPYNAKGRVLELMGRNNEAIWNLQKSFELDPSDPTPLNIIANMLQSLGRSEEAIDYFNRGLKLNSDHLLILCNRGHLFRSLGRVEEAINDFKAVKELVEKGEIDERLTPGNLSYVEDTVRMIEVLENQGMNRNNGGQGHQEQNDKVREQMDDDDTDLSVEALLKKVKSLRAEFEEIQDEIESDVGEILFKHENNES